MHRDVRRNGRRLLSLGLSNLVEEEHAEDHLAARSLWTLINTSELGYRHTIVDVTRKYLKIYWGLIFILVKADHSY